MTDYIPLLMMLSLLVGIVNGDSQLKICLGKKKVLWKLPEIASCDYDLATTSDVGQPRKIKLFKKNTLEYKSPGYVCRLETMTVRQQTLLNGVPEVREEPNPPETLSESECQQMVTEKKCKYGQLEKGRSIYRTHNQIEIDPPNRIMTFLNGEKINVKRNCLLFEIKVFSHYGSTSATSAMGDLSGCSYAKGICRTKENEFFLWRVNRTQSCEYVKAYVGVAIVNNQSAVIEDLHAMVTFNTSITKQDCDQKIILTDQGLGIQIGFPINNRSQRDPGPRNVKPISKAPLVSSKKTRISSTTAKTTTTHIPTEPPTKIVPSRRTTARTSRTTARTSRTTARTLTTTTQIPTTTRKNTSEKEKVSTNPQQMLGLVALLRGATKEEMMAKGYSEEAIDKFIARMKPRFTRQSNLDVSEEESSDLQFAEYFTLQQLRHLARAMCAMMREHSTRIREVMTINPTITMQRLLNRTNLVATHLNDKILEVEMCHNLQKDEYEIKPSPTECTVPVRIKQYNTTWFLDRHTQILHKSKEKVIEETCGPTLNIILDGRVNEYDRATGTITAVKQQLEETRLGTQGDKWNFLNQQYVFRDVYVHNVQAFEEELLQEMEMSIQKETEVLVHDQTILQHHDLQTDIIDSWELLRLIKKYVEVAWMIWVSISCALQTYGTITAILVYYKQRPTAVQQMEMVTYSTHGSPRVTRQ